MLSDLLILTQHGRISTRLWGLHIWKDAWFPTEHLPIISSVIWARHFSTLVKVNSKDKL